MRQILVINVLQLLVYLRIYAVQAYKMTSLKDTVLFFLSFTVDYVPAAIYALIDTEKTILKKRSKIQKKWRW